jgi:hypothetical protein
MTADYALTLRGVGRATILPHPMTLLSYPQSPASVAEDDVSLSYPIQTPERTWAYLEIEAQANPYPT